MSAASRGAREALAAGLVDELVGEGELPTALARWLRTFGRAHPRAVGQLKRHGLEIRDLSLQVAVARGQALTSAAVHDDALRTAIRRFQEEGVLPWEDE
jgi:enoyl-CoA hydratase/carnithine racemase